MFVAVLFSALALTGYIGLMIFTLVQNMHKKVNQAFAIYLAAMTFWQFAALIVSVREDPKSILLWYRLMTAGMGGQFIFYTFFILVFLDLERYRRVYVTGWLVFIALLASSGTGLIIHSVSRSAATNLFVPVFGPLVPVVGLVTLAFLAYGIYHLMHRYKLTRSSIQRNRIIYLLIGAGIIAAGSLTNLTPPLKGYPVDVAANLINAILIAYAIRRHQLLDIKLVVRKGLFYSIPTVIIGTAYFLMVSLAVGTFHASSNAQLFLSLVVAILAALLAQPLRETAQNWVDKLFFREKYNASLMLERLSRRAATILDLTSLTRMILEDVTRTIHIREASFFLKQGRDGDFRLAAQHGIDNPREYRLRGDHPVVEWLLAHDQVITRFDLEMLPQFKALWGQERRDLEELGAELFVPIRTKNELVGIFVLGEKFSEQPYSQDDQLTLTTLANQTAVAIENARLYWQLEQTLAALQKTHDELEVRVQERTADLAKVNQALQAEIGERRRAEEAIKRYTTELERSNQELQQFAYVASHDLQEPLRMVSSYMQLLERRYGQLLPSDAKEFIAFAVDGAKRMQELINDLLAYSRVGTRGKPFEPVDLKGVIERAKHNLKIAIEENSASIVHNHSDRRGPVVQGDPTQLTQLFQNLIGNAIKFHANRPPVIQIGEEQQDGFWRISVADNGIGIEPQYTERIFLIFQRLHGRDEYPGNGIGLAICKRIIERHGGRIWVESKPGEGSTFYFTIPKSQGVTE